MAAQSRSREANRERQLAVAPCVIPAFLGPSEHYRKPMNDDEVQQNCVSESGSAAASEVENNAENEEDDKIDNKLVNDSNATTVGYAQVLKSGHKDGSSMAAPSFLNAYGAENKLRLKDYANFISELFGDAQVHIEAINKRLCDFVKKGIIDNEKAEVVMMALCRIINDAPSSASGPCRAGAKGSSADLKDFSKCLMKTTRRRSLTEAIGVPGFDAKRYLAEYLKNLPGDVGRNLKALRSVAQSLADSYTDLVKKNVFYNYDQFVDTARKVLELENELVTFGQFLNDQKSLIDSLMNLPFSQNISELRSFGQRVPERRNLVQQLLETVENCQLKDSADKELVFESDLTQLNPDNMLASQIVHAFLFTDGLMLTTFTPKRLSSVRYRFSAFYELENVAFINVKNSDACQNVFKVLIFPEQIYFCCESSLIKKQWFESVEKAKKIMLRQGSLLRQATIRVKAGKQTVGSSDEDPAKKPMPLNGSGQKKNDVIVDAEWLKELPDELDVCIAQRDFNSALELLTEARDCLAECGDAMLVEDLGKKFDQRQKQLVEKLISELKPASDKYLQGGPRATRKAITLLIKLGKISEACDLHLKNRSVGIKFAVKELKVIDNAVQYVEQLNRAILNVIVETVREFKKLFVGYDLCFSVLTVWASSELKNYANLLAVHVFDSGCCLSVAASCLALAFSSLESLAHLNLDLSFQLEMLLQPYIEKLIADTERLLTDAISLRIAEDRWRPFNLQSENNLLKYVDDLKECGLDVSDTKADECRLWLTGQVCNFARAVLPFTRHLGSLCASAPFASSSCDASLLNVWSMELNYFDRKAADVDQVVHGKNVEFIVGYLLPLCEENYRVTCRLKDCTLLRDHVKKVTPKLLPFYRPFVGQADAFESIGEV